MKNTFTFIAVSIFSISTIFAQNFGVSLDYALWNGKMIDGIYAGSGYDCCNNPTSTNSVILGVNYSLNLSEKLDLVGSAGYGFGFKVIPLKADFNYGITNKISANLGIGMYMISDSVYNINAKGQLVEGTEERKEASTNEFGVNFGLSYQVTPSIALTGNYNVLKNGDYDFNGISFGLSYTFGNQTKHKGNKEEIKQAFVEQPINTNDINIIEENKELLKELKQAKSEISTKNTEINRLSSTLDSKNNELETAKLELKNYSERSIELEMKQYLGVKLPVFNTYSFSSAFRIAGDKYGYSRDQKFWWNKNVYTTERK
jgi:opacity protein-like surface antigen